VETSATTARLPGPRPPLDPEAALRLVRDVQARTAILVEGWSDKAALEALARRRGRDLAAEGIVVVPIGGATNVQRFLQALGPHGLGMRLAGLCDVAELPHVRRGLERAGMPASPGTSSDMTGGDRGFYACDADLEDELIRALGTAAVERVLDAEGELASFRRFQDQPAQRGRDLHAQLRRFLGTRAGRKVRYGALLVDALELDRVPPALDRVLEHVRG
jgi:OLD-like protein